MRTYITKNKKLNIVISLLFWLVVWQGIAMVVDSTLLLPSPLETLIALGGLVMQKSFYFDVGWTIFRCILAMALSFVLGVICAWAAYRLDVVRSLMALPVSFFKAVPVMAVVIYLILLMQSDWVAVAACFLMCFPIVYTNLLAGLDAVSTEFLELGTVYRLKPIQIIKLVYVPSIQPQIKSAVKLIAGLSWKAVVAAEVLSIPAHSLGYGMMNAKYYLETPTLFAYVIVIIVLSMAMEKLINLWLETLDIRSYQGSQLAKSSLGDLTSSPLKAPRISLNKVSKAYGEQLVLNKVSRDFDSERVNVISGPSGSGKTTLVRIIAGLESADSGDLDFDKPVRVSYLFQEDRLLPWLNVYDNLAIGLINDDIEEAKVIKMAEALELGDSLWKLPSELSGGMKHRVALGRTFLADANVMILDEPLRGLDDALKSRIIDRLWEPSTKGKTVILITHNEQDLSLIGEVL